MSSIVSLTKWTSLQRKQISNELINDKFTQVYSKVPDGVIKFKTFDIIFDSQMFKITIITYIHCKYCCNFWFGKHSAKIIF